MLADGLRWRLFRLNSAAGHWLRRRFTPAGWLMLCALAGSALWGFDTTQSMAYQSFALCLALLAAALLLSGRGPSGVRARRCLPRFGTAGQPLPYVITVENVGAGPRRGLAVSEELEDPRPDLSEFSTERNPADGRPLRSEMRPFWLDRFAGFTRWRALVARKRLAQAAELPLPDLPPGGRVEVSARLLPARRGRLSLPGLILSQPEPLGLAKACRRQEQPQQVLILPKRYPVPRLALAGARRYQAGGVALASSVGESQEFMGLRDYRAGDPVRRVHWRGWAKAGRPVVKEFEDEYFTRHALILDTFAGPGQAELFEEAVSVAASFACSVLTQESLLDLLFVGARPYCFTAGRGLGRAEGLLEVLACAQPCAGKPFSELSAAVSGRGAALSGAICVLLGYDEARRGLARLLRGLGVAVRVFVLADGPVEAEPGVDVLEAGRVAEGLARVRP